MKHRVTLPAGVSLPTRMKSSEFAAMMRGTPPPSRPGDPPLPDKVHVVKSPIRLPKPLKMSGAEAEYERVLMTQFEPKMGFEIKFEAISFRLPGGSRYTPDFSVWYKTELHLLVEVKGSYRLGSAGRSHLAFKEAIAAFPHLRFRYAAKNGQDWIVTNSAP